MFHGGSGTPVEEIRETLDYGVVKMNIDTDTQYAFTRPVVDHIFKNYDGVLKIDGEIGNKKAYDPAQLPEKSREPAWPTAWPQACDDLRSTGQNHLRQGVTVSGRRKFELPYFQRCGNIAYFPSVVRVISNFLKISR